MSDGPINLAVKGRKVRQVKLMFTLMALHIFSVNPVFPKSTIFRLTYTPCPKKNIPDIFDCNVNKDYQILIIFDTNIFDTTGSQMTVEFSTTPIVCFCTTWGNKTNEILHFYPISPVRVFRDSA